MISFARAIPILRIFSVPKGHEFYLGYLGFSVDWEHVSSLSCRSTPRSAGTACCCS